MNPHFLEIQKRRDAFANRNKKNVRSKSVVRKFDHLKKYFNFSSQKTSVLPSSLYSQFRKLNQYTLNVKDTKSYHPLQDKKLLTSIFYPKGKQYLPVLRFPGEPFLKSSLSLLTLK